MTAVGARFAETICLYGSYVTVTGPRSWILSIRVKPISGRAPGPCLFGRAARNLRFDLPREHSRTITAG